jgi:nitrogen fixation negative regulator NifL
VLKSGGHDAAFYERLWATIQSGEVWRGEMVNRRKDGSVYVEEQTITPVRDEAGEITHFIAIKQDIGARKEAEESLRRSEASYRTLVDNAPLGIFRSRADGTFLAVNPALVKILGHDSAAELLARNIMDVYQDPTERLRAVELLHNGPVKDFHVEWKRKDGTLITVRNSARALKDHATDAEIFEAIVEDVTEKRRADALLQQAEKLTTLGGLISGVAHELNNPLTVLTGFAHLLTSRPDVPLDMKEQLEAMKAATQRAAKIVKNLLTFARQQPSELSRLSLPELVDQALDLLAYPLRVNGVTVVRDFAADAPAITADRDQLLQVLLNILQNALHAMAQSERRQIVGRLTFGDARVRLEFEDTGPGIPPALVGRVFEPFFTTKAPGQGTGLGLSICYGIVKSHGGEIVAENVPGGGARFVIELPLGAPFATTPSKTSASESAVRDVTPVSILAVDDEPEILSFLSQLLGRFGYLVQTAASGREALERLKRGECFEAILLDMRMPGMDGRTLYRELVRSFPDASRRVIFSTGDLASGDTQGFVASTRRPSVLKPFAPGDLVRVLDAAIAK